MLARLMTRSVDLSRLRSEGFDIDVIEPPHLVLKGVPYLTASKEVKFGSLVSVLDVGGEETVKPGTHVIYFIGDVPCNADGTPIRGVNQDVNQVINKDIRPAFQFRESHEPMIT